MFAFIALDFDGDLHDEEEPYQGSCNVYDNFDTLELIHPGLDLGPHGPCIRQELLFHEPEWLEALEKKFLMGNETDTEYQEKMNMQLILAHDQLHVVHQDISCCVYDNYEPAHLDWFLTAMALWASAHFKEDYLFNEEKWGVSKESPILKYRITEWPNYLNTRQATKRPILSLQDLCRNTIQSTLGTAREFQLYKHLLTCPSPKDVATLHDGNDDEKYKKEKEEPPINNG